ncbi:hypothetical protein [Sulfurisphaera ohwakuensis]|uniref:Ribosomal protein L29 n=1 Tax=Sulfurisphaera ohwakuensis TaxID=69656 RepID=A0A650CGF7_SULOH|nr:hypothetical protein [Sulfurisphaera ohwakuensis]MBB5254236.1 ribosomal protein L29 [Sulfurisphaera ohwakuensis]QGR16828.1 hypothetical protein D1869_06235 [Sulfurisphaera ohwakuensis]
MEPFYFKSYEKVVGTAHNVQELEKEIARIGATDPACVNWHLEQGHIVSWLKYIGNNTLAEMLKGVKDWREALARIRDYYAIQQKTTTSSKRKWRKSQVWH